MEKEIEKVGGKPVHTYNEVIGDTGLGQRIEDGDILIITGVTIDEGPFGGYVVFDTTEGKRYSGATAIMDFALKLREKPELMPVKVRAIEVVSAVGRKYIRFTEP